MLCQFYSLVLPDRGSSPLYTAVEASTVTIAVQLKIKIIMDVVCLNILTYLLKISETFYVMSIFIL